MGDPYSVLGVARTAKAQEIKSAFRKLAKKYHPDHNQDDAKAKERFSEINQAYEIIGDKEKRAQFDRGEIDGEGKPVFQGFGGGGNGAGGNNPFGGRSHFDFRSTQGVDPNDIFGSFFGAGARNSGFSGFNARPQQPRRGADLQANLTVSLEQIAGADKVTATFPNGKTLAIKLPNYAEDGQAIRLKGQGEAIAGGRPGDAIVTIKVKPHNAFRMEGRALHIDLPVALKDAVLGAKYQVDTLEGRVSLSIPAWSSSDRVLRLKEKGLPLKSGGRDDLYVHVRIMLPESRDKALEHFFESENQSST